MIAFFIPFTNSSKRRPSLLKAALSLLLLLLAGTGFAQADSTAREGLSLAPSLQFITIQKADNSIDLKASLKAKLKGVSYKLYRLKVSFVLVTDSAEKDLGFVITNNNGNAVLNVKADALAPNKEGKLHFKAVFAGNKQMEAADGEATISRAKLEINPVKQDSVYTVQIKMTDIATGKPVAKNNG